MDAAAKGQISEAIAECEALLHALVDEASSPDGADSAAMLVEALVRKGGELRNACAATGDGSMRRASEWVELAGNQLDSSPGNLVECVEEFRNRLAELRSLCAASVQTTDRARTSRRVAILRQDESFVGVPLVAMSGVRVGGRAGGALEIALTTEFGGGAIRAHALHSFIEIEEAIGSDESAWPERVSLGDEGEAKILVHERPAPQAVDPAPVAAQQSMPPATEAAQPVPENGTSLVSSMTPLSDEEMPRISGPS